MFTRKLPLTLTAAMLALAALSVVWLLADKAHAANKPAPPPPALTNPAIACDISGAICLYSADGKLSRQITTNPYGAGDDSPVWSPDGKQIAFRRGTQAGKAYYQLCVMNADGSNVQVLANYGLEDAKKGLVDGTLAWSPDGAYLLQTSDDNLSIMKVIDIASGAVATITDHSHGFPLPAGILSLAGGSFSPDLDPADGFQGYLTCGGSWYADPLHQVIAHGLVIVPVEIVTENAGNPATAVVHITTGAPSVLAGDMGAPAWSHDGGAIAYLGSPGEYLTPNEVGTVTVELDPLTGGIVFGTPTVLCDHWCATDTLHRLLNAPTWSSDDQWVAFGGTSLVSKTTYYYDIFRVPSDGAGPAAAVTSPTDKVTAIRPTWNPAWDPTKP